MKAILFFAALLASSCALAQAYDSRAYQRQQEQRSYRLQMLLEQQAQTHALERQASELERQGMQRNFSARPSLAEQLSNWPAQRLQLENMHLQNELLRRQLQQSPMPSE